MGSPSADSSENGGGSVGGGVVNGGGGASTPRKLTTIDALSYLKEVKNTFPDQKEKYDMFLQVMKDFKAQKTDTHGVIAAVKELFKGHNNLIYGFNAYLPKGHEIRLDEDEAPQKKKVEFEDAISFVGKIKNRFQNEEHVYKSFLDILNMYREEHKTITEVYSEVATLFKDHNDLLEEFTRFLPDNSLEPSTQHAPFGHRDLSVEHPDVDDEEPMNMHKEQRKREIRDIRKHDLNSLRSPNKKKSVKKAEANGLSSDLASHDDKDALKIMYSQALSLCAKVKERLSSAEDYQTFLKCLHNFSNGIIKKNELQNMVTDLLGKHSDLMSEFNDYLERCENTDGFLAGVASEKPLDTDGHLSESTKLEDDEDKEHKHEMEVSEERETYREKYMGKSIQELDLSVGKRCSLGYQLLPTDDRLDICIHIVRGDKSDVRGCSGRSQQSHWRQRAWIGLDFDMELRKNMRFLS
ncbi:paired amphipathic helix protein [Medicago truncatula]|uniref:Paired amphipathic helix protein n=1 Tax=Medicago truncatula TaxID=3880 RepID=A0A072UGN0_MEDTR|nr:paired amphipathic helix protein [Medicago truncatula]